MNDELKVAATGSESSDLDVRAIGSDPVALERFYRMYLVEVERFVARRVSEPGAAADITADIFLSAMDACQRFDEEQGSPRAWLYGIAYRVIARNRRLSARRFMALGRHAGQRELEEDSIGRLEEHLDAEAAMRRFRESIGRLPRVDRALLELTALDELTVAEAAVILGLTPGAARTRLHRARARLQRALAEGVIAPP